MRTLLFLFLLLLLGVGLSFLIHQDPGYVVIGYNHTTIASSLWVALAIIVVVFVASYFVVRLLKNIFSIPEYFSHRRVKLNLQRYQKYMIREIVHDAVGDYRAAEKAMVKLLKKNQHYTVYLLAAKAAQQQKAYDRRDAYLKSAFQVAKDDTFTVSLTQGLLYFDAEQYDEALVTLKPLYKNAPKNALLLKALKELYFKHHDWESLKLILPQLKKQGLISKEELLVV